MFISSFCLLGKHAIYYSIAHDANGYSSMSHLQNASTAKLLGSPLHGSPNVSVDTSTLQLFEPMQACKSKLRSKA